jgi:hypothetical protein
VAKAKPAPDNADDDTIIDATNDADAIPEGHTRVRLVKPCTVTLQDGSQKGLVAGVHILPDAIANHWYVQLHTAAGGGMPAAGAVDPDAPVEIGEGEVEINMVKPCTITLQDGSTRVIAAGRQSLPKEIAEHWFVKHHSDDPPESAVVPGTAAFADRERARVARQHILDTAAEQAASAAQQEVRDATKANPPANDADPQPAPSRRRRVPVAGEDDANDG